MKALQYTGEFTASDNSRVRVELWQEAEAPTAHVGLLSFAGNEALTIKWNETDPDQPIEKSHATLRIISETDRAYLSLVSDADADVRMDVYVNGSLYWSGTMDSEQYSEPYERESMYEVEMTFVDLGVLDRMKYLSTRVESLGEIVRRCLYASGVNFAEIDWSMSSVLTTEGRPVHSAVGVDAQCWIDSDGEPRTMYEVLEESLGGLGLRLRQRAGRFWVYDLRGLKETQPHPLRWSSDSQTLSFSEIYKSLKFTWEPWCRSGDMLEDKPWGDEDPPSSLVNYYDDPLLTHDGAEYCTLPVHWPHQNWSEDAATTLWLKGEGRGLETSFQGAKVMACVPQNAGQKAEGVALRWGLTVGTTGGGTEFHQHGIANSKLWTLNMHYTPLLSTKSIRLTGENEGIRLRLTVPIFIGWEWNPWADTDEAKYGTMDLKMKSQYYAQANYIYMPVFVYFRDDRTGTLWQWSNRSVLPETPETGNTLENYKVWRIGTGQTMGEWIPATGQKLCTAWLAYYDPAMIDGKTGNRSQTVMGEGWTNNRQTVNPLTRYITENLRRGEGQLIPWPDKGPGDLWLEVPTDAWKCKQYGVRFKTTDATELAKEHYALDGDSLRWLLLGAPSLTAERERSYDAEIDTGSVETIYTLNERAHEELDVQCKCAAAEGKPTARGAYMNMQSLKPVTQLRRYGVAGGSADLVAAVMLGQYGRRMKRLSGEADIDLGALAPVSVPTETSMFAIIDETQNLADMTTEATLLELGDYDNIPPITKKQR